MKYSNINDTIGEKVCLYSKQLDKAIDLLTVAEEIAYAKNVKLIELRNYQIKCLYDFAEDNSYIPKIKFGDKSIVDRANILNSAIFQYYIKADILYCGSAISSYLKSIREWTRDENKYAIKDNIFNNGVLYGMKIKCLPNSIIPRDEFIYVDKETDEIIKYKIEGVN